MSKWLGMKRPSFKFEVQRSCEGIEEFLGCPEAMAFPWSAVELVGDVVALLLCECRHAGSLG